MILNDSFSEINGGEVQIAVETQNLTAKPAAIGKWSDYKTLVWSGRN